MTEPTAITRIVVRPLASPLPLGFFAFGVGIALYTALQLGWLPASSARSVALLGLAFVAPLEMLAAIIGFLGRDAAGGTTMGIFSATWVALGVIELTAGPHAPALAAFVFADCAMILLLALAAIGSKPFFSVILLLAFARFFLTGLATLQLGRGVELASGILGLPLFAVALYGGLALLVEDMAQKPVLPLFRRGPAKRAVEGELDEQLAGVAREVGVRSQL